MADHAMPAEQQAPKAAMAPEMLPVSPELAPGEIPDTDLFIADSDPPSQAPESMFGSSSVPVDRSNGQGTAVMGQVGPDVPDFSPSLLPPPPESHSMSWPAVAGITMGVIFILSVMLAALYMLYTCRANARRRREGLDDPSPGKYPASFTTPNRPFLPPTASPRRSTPWRTAPLEPPYSGSPPPPFLQHWIDTLLPEAQLEAPYNPTSNPDLPRTAPVRSQNASASTEQPSNAAKCVADTAPAPLEHPSGHTSSVEHPQAAIGPMHATKSSAAQELEMAVVSSVGYTAVSGLDSAANGRKSAHHQRGLSHTASHMVNSSTFVSATSGELTGAFAVTGSLLEEPPSGALTQPELPRNDDSVRFNDAVTRSAPLLRASGAKHAAQHLSDKLDSHPLDSKDVSDASEIAELDSPGPQVATAHEVSANARANSTDGSSPEDAKTGFQGTSEASNGAAPVAEATSCMSSCPPSSTSCNSANADTHDHHASRAEDRLTIVHVGYMHERPRSEPSDHGASQLAHLQSMASSYCGSAIQQEGQHACRLQGGAQDLSSDACASGRISQGLPPIAAHPPRHHAHNSIASELENAARMHCMQPSVLQGPSSGPLPSGSPSYPPSYPPTLSRDASASTLPAHASFKSPFRKTHTITARACYSQGASGSLSLDFTESERATLPTTIETAEDQEAVSTGACTSIEGVSDRTLVSTNSAPAPHRHQNDAHACSDDGANSAACECEDGVGVGLGTVPEASDPTESFAQKTAAGLAAQGGDASLGCLGEPSAEKQAAFGGAVSGVSGSSVSRCVNSQLTDLSTLMHEHDIGGTTGSRNSRSTEDEYGMHGVHACESTTVATEQCDKGKAQPSGLRNMAQQESSMVPDAAESGSHVQLTTPAKVPPLRLSSAAQSVSDVACMPHMHSDSDIAVSSQKSAHRRLGGLFAEVKATWKGLRSRWGSRRPPLGPADLEAGLEWGCGDPHWKSGVACNPAIRQSAFVSSGSASVATSGANGDVSSSDVSSCAASETYAGASMHAFHASAASVMQACTATGMHAFDALRHMHGPSTVVSEDVASVVVNVPVDTQFSKDTDASTAADGASMHGGPMSCGVGTGGMHGASLPANTCMSKGSKQEDGMHTMHAHSVTSSALSMVRNSSGSSRLAPATPPWNHQSPRAGGAVGWGAGMQFAVGSPNQHRAAVIANIQRSRSGSGGSTPPAHAFHAQSSGQYTPSTQTSQESPSLHVPAALWGSMPMHADGDMLRTQHAQRSSSPLAAAANNLPPSQDAMFRVVEASRSHQMYLTSTEGSSSTEYSGSPVKHLAQRGRSGLSTNTTAVISDATLSSTPTPTAGASPDKASMHAAIACDREKHVSSWEYSSTPDGPRKFQIVPKVTPAAAGMHGVCHSPAHALSASLAEEASVSASLLLNRNGMHAIGADPNVYPPMGAACGGGPLPVDLTDEDVSLGISSPPTNGAPRNTPPLAQFLLQAHDSHASHTTESGELESVTACMPGHTRTPSATQPEEASEEGSEPEASTLELKEYLERTLNKVASGPSTLQMAKRMETPPATHNSDRDVAASADLPKTSKLRWKSVKNFNVGDEAGPSDGDTDDIGGVWMTLPGVSVHEPHALISAPGTDDLYDASNTLSITLGVAPRLDEERSLARAPTAPPPPPPGTSSKSLHSGSFSSTCDPGSPVSLSARPALRAASKARSTGTLRHSKAPNPPSNFISRYPPLHLSAAAYSCSTRQEGSGPCMSDVEGSGSMEASGRCKMLCAHAPVATALGAESSECAAHSSAGLSARRVSASANAFASDGAPVATTSARMSTVPLLTVPGDALDWRPSCDNFGRSSVEGTSEGSLLEGSAVASGANKLPSPRPRPRTPRALAQRLPSTVPEDSMVKECCHGQNLLVEGSGILQWPSGVSGVSGSTTTGAVRPSKYDMVDSGALTSVHTVLSAPRRSNDTEVSVSKYELLGDSAPTTLIAGDTTLPSIPSDAESLSRRSLRDASPSPPLSQASDLMHPPRGRSPDSMHERSEGDTAFMTPAGSVWAADSVSLSLMGGDDSGAYRGNAGGLSTRGGVTITQHWARMGLFAESSEASVEVVQAS